MSTRDFLAFCCLRRSVLVAPFDEPLLPLEPSLAPLLPLEPSLAPLLPLEPELPPLELPPLELPPLELPLLELSPPVALGACGLAIEHNH
jgi:hypothetical protein